MSHNVWLKIFVKHLFLFEAIINQVAINTVVYTSVG
jgi:hypothetical protein